ncbi:MAG TPA: hypothetical protein VJN93_10555 [Candidatus Acidoferrum sp.]|nr:hypothetical protein [Candidatus Acidoferrum sp.]
MDGRKAITTFARTFLGSHYLWGSAGAIPGFPNGARYRPGAVPWNEASLRIQDLSICAAKCDVDGHYVCAGRFDKCGGMTVSDTDTHVGDFLKKCSDEYPNAMIAQWESIQVKLTPRRVQGKDVPSAGKIAWGENCYGKRHFDCISFVNYVLTETAVVSNKKEGWHGGIENYASDYWTKDVPLTDAAVAGDILIRFTDGDDGKRHYHHIGFLDDNGYVVQAEMASAGVHADERYNAANWQMRRRVPDSQLRQGT